MFPEIPLMQRPIQCIALHWTDNNTCNTVTVKELHCCVLCRMGLKYYETNAITAADVFKLPVPFAAVSKQLSR